MKDLRDYYKGPPKVVSEDEGDVKSENFCSTKNICVGENIDKSKNETSESVEASCMKKPSTIVGVTSVNTNCNVDTVHELTCKDEKENETKDVSSKHKRKSRKSKSSRKPSDPAVKSITELLNASLSIISPKSSMNESQKSNTPSNIEEQSPWTEKIKPQRSSSVKKKLRRSSSDFDTHNSVKSSTSNGSIESERNDKSRIDSEKISVDTRDKSTEHNDIRPVKTKKSFDKKFESRKSKRRANHSEKEKVKDVNKIMSESVINNSTKKNNNVQNLVDDLVVIGGDESFKSGGSNELCQSQETPKPKINAFQFMMESRLKSIGQNSTGKDVSTNEVIEEEKDKKQKRLSRKLMLENWVESKADVKRKRVEEEEKDVYIRYQLEKRAKRLKKLLNPHDDGSKENVKQKLTTEVKSKRKSSRKRVIKPVIDSDSESSSDFVESKQNKNKARVSHEKSLKDEDGNKTNVLGKENSNNPNGLLTFLGITDKLKMHNSDEQNEEKISSETRILKSKSGKKLKKTKLESSDKTREFSIEENANLDLPTTHKDRRRSINSNNIEKQVSQSSVDEISVDGNTSHCHSSVDIFERSCSQDLIDPKKSFQTPRPKKHRKKETMEDHLLGRSPRGWKMKIRLTDDEGTSTSDSFAAKKEILRQESDQELSDKKQNNSEQLKEVKQERPKRKIASTSGARVSELILSSDSDSEIEFVSPQKKPGRNSNIKLAPVFVKAVPKAKIDPKVVQARKDFLMSGVPDQLKKDIERQISVEDIEVEVFPMISHIQQKSPENIYWDIQSPELKLMSVSPLKSDSINLMYHELTSKHMIETIRPCKTFQKLEVCKRFIEQIKSKNPSYPVYKCFKSIYEKSGLKNKKTTEKNLEDGKKKIPKQKRGRKKKKENSDDSVEIIEIPKEKFEVADFAMWTEKYKPTACSDIIGNTAGVTKLKKWLEKWTETLEESVQKKKRKRNGSTSESDFDYTDGDSRGSTCESKNTVILNGPNGSGKTSAVYAICTELGMNVLELNASSKRTGKRLLQELQEATQSHQVMKGEFTALSQFIKIEKPKHQCQSEGHHAERNKICVLLVEDIDIIFEQDEGFLSALTQLIVTSKRPIILTTTNNTSPIICRFTTQYMVIDFKPLAARVLSVWLHILCLIEGVSVDVQSIGHLLGKNNGDVRKTILELQYWVQSGGNLRENKPESLLFVKNNEDKGCSSDDKFQEDDNSNMSFVNDNVTPQNELKSHTDCLESFEITSHGKLFNIPYTMSLSKIWWNLPNIFSLQSSTIDVAKKEIYDKDATEPDELCKNQRLYKKKKLDAICKVYDSLLYADLMKKEKDCLVDLEPCPRQWENALKDGLELTENFNNYSSSHDLTEDICHTLTDGCIYMYKKDYQTSYSINMGLPSLQNKRWREKQHLCEDILQDALSHSCYADRRAVSVDFMPVLRQIGRSEMVRSSQTSKRGNRFNNYLRGLGIDGGDSSYKIVCNVLNVDKFKPSCL